MSAEGAEPPPSGAARGPTHSGNHAQSGTANVGRGPTGTVGNNNATTHHNHPSSTNGHSGGESSLSMMSGGGGPPASGFGPAAPAGVSMGYSSHHHPAQPPPPQEYGSSWRNPMTAALAGAGGGGGPGSTGAQPGMAATAEAFSNYYFSGGYSPFSGDIRDSIAAIWSRTSPSGEGVAAAYSSGYGAFPDTSTGQFAANATPTGQFAANLTGHFTPGSEMGMFGTGPDYPPAAYGQPQFNYGQQYSQWPESAGLPNTNASSSVGSGNNGGIGNRNGVSNPRGTSSYGTGYGGDTFSREMTSRHSQERGSDLSNGMDTLKLTSSSRRGEDLNGHSEGAVSHGKKMSWASVASQPAKPQSIVPKTKKPGVLPPPTLIPSASKTLPVDASNTPLPPSPPLENLSAMPLPESDRDRTESFPLNKREGRQPNQSLHSQHQDPEQQQQHFQPSIQHQYQPLMQQQQQHHKQPQQMLSHHHNNQHQQLQQQQQQQQQHDPSAHRSSHQGRGTGSHSPTMRKTVSHHPEGGRLSERHPVMHPSPRDMHDSSRGGYGEKSGSNSGPRNQRQYSNANGGTHISSGSSLEFRSGNGRSGHSGPFNSGERKRIDRMADFGGAAPTSGSHGSPPSLQASHHPILESLQSQNEYNPKTFDLNPKNAKFFVIKSFSEDDIHRSIKYEIWCSTDHGNKRLDAGFKERNGKGPVYLLFSVNGSGHFCGMAEMLSGVDYNATGSVWVQDKFKGQFKVKWIYVKDVPNGQLRHIRLENNENKPVTNSRDTQEVPPDKGKQVLKIIHTYKHQTSIFDDFIHYEKRQEEEEGKKSMSAAPLSGHSTRSKDASDGGGGGGTNYHSHQHASRSAPSGGGKDGQETHHGGGQSSHGGGRGGRGAKLTHYTNNQFNSNTKNTNNMGSKTQNSNSQGSSNRR